jgi:hypothetical protein
VGSGVDALGSASEARDPPRSDDEIHDSRQPLVTRPHHSGSAGADSSHVFYRCAFSGQTATELYECIISGRSMVRFDDPTEVRLYKVSCSTYNYSNYIAFDFGC